MKILIAYTASGTSDNPFVRLLADGIRACGYEVVCSVEEFRSNAADYDIVHLQWPEELFRWKAPAPADVDTLEQQLQTLKNNGIPLIYTRHNTLPHHGNPLVAEAYGLVERYADAIVHLGDCSLREFTAAHPDSEQLQVVIPHHIYEGLYDMDITRDAGRRALGIPADRLVVLAFGAFRHAEERRLVWGAFRRLPYPAKFLLAPRLWPYTRRGSAVQRAETARRTPALRRGTYRRRFLRQPHHLARTADPRRTAALLSRRRRRGFHPADGHPQFGQRPAGAELRACGNGSRQRQHRRPARRDGQPGIRSRRPAVGGHRAGTGRAPLGDGPRRPQPRLCAGTLRHRTHRRNVRRALRTTL